MIKMHARFNSKCRECLEAISENDLFYFDPAEEKFNQKAVCLDCGDLSFEQLEAKLAKLKTRDRTIIDKHNCANDLCDNQCFIKYYFCTKCFSKLPYTNKRRIEIVYGLYLQDKQRYLHGLIKSHKEALPYLK